MLPTLLLNVPTVGKCQALGPQPLSCAAQLAATTDLRCDDALADRDAGVWRTWQGRWGAAGEVTRGPATASGQPGLAPQLPSRCQLRVLLSFARDRVGACMGTLMGDEVAPESDDVFDEARRLDLPATPDLTTTESVQAAFADGLDAAAALGAAEAERSTNPPMLMATTLFAAIRSSPHGKAPGPSG